VLAFNQRSADTGSAVAKLVQEPGPAQATGESVDTIAQMGFVVLTRIPIGHERSGQKNGWQKNEATGRRRDDIFLRSMFLPDLVQPLQGWRSRGTANPGCADVPRPWATVRNAFGVEERASVSEIPTYVGERGSRDGLFDRLKCSRQEDDGQKHEEASLDGGCDPQRWLRRRPARSRD
jgi:hypothetical protein